MSGQRASAAPGGGNGCDHNAGAAAADGLKAGRTCAAVRPLPAVTFRGNAPALRRAAATDAIMTLGRRWLTA
ncbi:hypothetical protein JYY74_004226 [Salmonella enterica subsp. enterica serovar Enteritidis]|nr:hypothetical protein [Salmonella enterica subsp. enterica serovar Enteritidis]